MRLEIQMMSQQKLCFAQNKFIGLETCPFLFRFVKKTNFQIHSKSTLWLERSIFMLCGLNHDYLVNWAAVIECERHGVDDKIQV